MAIFCGASGTNYVRYATGIPKSVFAGGAVTISVWFQCAHAPGSGSVSTVVGLTGSSPAAGVQLQWDQTTASFRQAWDVTNNGSGFAAAAYTGLTSNTWYHLLFTYGSPGSADARAYLNGVFKTVNSTVANVMTASTGAYVPVVFANTGGSNLMTNGTAADFAIWNVALTQSEITSLAQGARPSEIRPTALALYWPLFNLQTTEADLSGNKRNGTVTGTVTTANDPQVQAYATNAG